MIAINFNDPNGIPIIQDERLFIINMSVVG